MLYIDFEANTEKEATQLALESLGLSLSEVKIEALNTAKKGFLGLGKKEKAKIRVYYKEKNEINDIINSIKKIITDIDKGALVEATTSKDDRYNIIVEATEPGRLIGKSGNTLKSLQNIINCILQKHGNKYKIVLDINNYSSRLQENILANAQHIAKKVLKTKREILLDPLNPFQRRLIHIDLKSFAGIKTESIGEGKYKSIRIALDDGE